MAAEGQGDSFTFDLLLDRYLVRELDLEVTLHDVEAAGLVLEVEDDIFCLLVTDPELPQPRAVGDSSDEPMRLIGGTLLVRMSTDIFLSVPVPIVEDSIKRGPERQLCPRLCRSSSQRSDRSYSESSSH